MIGRFGSAARLAAVRARAPLLSSAAATAAMSSLAAPPTACAPAVADGGPLAGLSFNPMDLSALQVQMLTVSGLTGYTAGFAVKRTFKVFIFTAGCIFIGLQSLANNGLVTVHWDEIETRMKSVADVNSDGVVNGADLQNGQERLQAYLSAGLPSAGSFGGAPRAAQPPRQPHTRMCLH